jgi:hypothetical protein
MAEPITNNCSCDGSHPNFVVQCKSCASCNGDCNIEARNEITQKRIWKQVRAYSSLYTMANAAANVGGDFTNLPLPKYSNVNWNQMSDRNRPGVQIAIVPSRGNSTRSSITRERPGACSPGGKGVDIKHGSYDRYLARRKSNLVRNQLSSTSLPLYGNKSQTYGMLSQTCVKCEA